MIVIVMGVSGAGKTTIGRRLADSLGWRFIEADDLHPAVNIAKLQRGEPLTDADRDPWLERLSVLLADLARGHTPAVVACSALKQRYRERLRASVGPGTPMRFVYLRLTRPQAAARVGARVGHFMPAALVDSQFAALEEPGDALTLDATLPPDELVARIRETLAP